MKWETFPITYPFFSVSILKNSINNKEFNSIFNQNINIENAGKLNKILTQDHTIKPLYLSKLNLSATYFAFS